MYFNSITYLQNWLALGLGNNRARNESGSSKS
jgi:hypothetical protein